MIRNLNQLNFKDFGTVSAERAATRTASAASGVRQLPGDCAVLQAKSDVHLSGCSGMTVLSVSADGADFQHFYLDKPVCVRKGIFFCISPFRRETASVEFISAEEPAPTGQKLSLTELQISHRLQVTRLYTFFYQEKEQGFFFPGESHPMLELTYVDQGSLHSVADGQDLLLGQGDMVIYGSNQWHMQYADIGVAPRFVTISFEMEGSDLSSLLGRKFTPPQQALSLLQQMLREQEHMDEYSTDVIISQLNLLLLSALRQDRAPVRLTASNSLHSENEIIRKAQQYISTHIRQKLSVPIVAQMVDVSPSYLTALFHKNLQISPGEYIRRIKLQESKQMIRENAMNFTEIAAALQYSTVHHFSRQFKEKFGITPTEYAKSVR